MLAANVAIMGTELWISGLTVPLAQLPCSLLFGLCYVGFHNGWRYEKTRTLLYFFLNWAREDAIRNVGALLVLFGGCYLVGVGVSGWLRPRAWGAPCLAIALAAIMKLRPPSE